MKRKKYILSALSAAIFVMLIVDAETASAGVSEGLELCMKVMIPSLFPFFIVSTYMNAALLGLQIPGLRYIGKLLRVPAGGESLLLLGMIGGYPVGAQLIADMYRQGILDKRTAQILLGYCSNAGPAFIFGVAGALFSALREPLFLWTIQLLSALTTGLLLPRPYCNNITAQHCNQLSITAALKTSISACVSVCGWIIVFKIVMTYISTYLAQQLSKAQMILLAGILELSNGCIMLGTLDNTPVRFLLCSLFLSFGGVCVVLQTRSVTDSLGLGLYIPGKCLQVCMSLILSILFACILFPENGFQEFPVAGILTACVAIMIGLKKYCEKRCGNPQKNHVYFS